MEDALSFNRVALRHHCGEVEQRQEHFRLLRPGDCVAIVDDEAWHGVDADAAGAVFLRQHLHRSGIGRQIAPRRRAAEPARAGNIGQHIGIADIQRLDEVCVKQGLDHYVFGTVVCSKAGKTVGVDRVWGLVDAVEGECDAFLTPGGGNICMDPRRVASQPELDLQIKLPREPVARQFGIELKRPPYPLYR